MRIRKILTILSVLIAATIGMGCGTQAESTSSAAVPVYHSDAMADFPILNVIDDNPRIGDFDNKTVASRILYLPDIAPGYEHAAVITMLLRTYNLSD